jgi:1,4-dihydroxy-2-naphthoate octaprenyltransferase
MVAFLVIAIAVMGEVINPLSFLVLLSFPLAIRNIKLMKTATMADLGIIQFLDGKTAQLVLIFSLLLAAANFMAPYI